MFFINSTIWPLRTNTYVTAIGFSPHFHTPATTTVYFTSPFNQHLQRRFQPSVTGRQVISDNATANTPLLTQNGCDHSKLLPLLRNLTLKDDTLIAIIVFMVKLPWTSPYWSINRILFYMNSTIFIHRNTFFYFWSLMWENSSLKIPVKITSSCPNHVPMPFPTPPFVLLHPFPSNPSKTSSQRIMYGECLNLSSAQKPLILVVRRRICKNIFMICASSVLIICNILSMYHTSFIRTSSYPYRMSPQTS